MPMFRTKLERPESIRLADGAALAIRPIAPTDKLALTRTFDRLSEESRYRRFFSPKQHLSDAELAYLTELDHSDREAFVAIDPESADCVGVARYTRSTAVPDRAELAVVVADDWQRRGVGRVLLERLTVHARQQGIRCFSARMKAFNQGALAAIAGLGEVRELHARVHRSGGADRASRERHRDAAGRVAPDGRESPLDRGADVGGRVHGPWDLSTRNFV